LGQSFVPQKNEGKDGTFGDSWIKFCQLHEKIGHLRLSFATGIHELSDEISNVAKNTERSRKQLKEAGQKQLKVVQESETLLEKAKLKYEWTSEDWEKAILQLDQQDPSHALSHLSVSPGVTPADAASTKKGSSLQKSISLTLFRGSSSATASTKLAKTEEEARHKASEANEAYKLQLIRTNALRQQYFAQQLPQVIRYLKDTNSECDQKLKSFLIQYTQAFESALVSEATTVCPLDKAEHMGLTAVVQDIEPDRDFDEFMMNYFQSKGKQFSKDLIVYAPYSMVSYSDTVYHKC
jgi:hypothetical protein